MDNEKKLDNFLSDKDTENFTRAARRRSSKELEGLTTEQFLKLMEKDEKEIKEYAEKNNIKLNIKNDNKGGKK